MRFSATSLFVTICLARHGTSDGLGRFSYREESSRRPSKWKKVDIKDNEWQEWKALKADKNECGKKKNRQSPVDLIQNEDCRADHEMLFTDGTCEIDDILFEVTPYSLKGTFPIKKCTPPGLDLSDSFHERYDNTFEVKLPGEHRIKGKKFDAEIQFSHVLNVLEEHETNRDHQIAMAARPIVAKKNKHDDYMETFITEWEHAADKKEQQCEDRGISTLQAPETKYAQSQRRERRRQRKLHENVWDLTQKRDHNVLKQPFKNQYYYGYKGSLTIPPCSDMVLWYVVDKPMKIDKKQLKRMQRLITNYLDDDCEKNTYASDSGAVNRPLQKKHKHKIFHCDESDYEN